MRADDFILETLAHFARGDGGPPPGIPARIDADFERDLIREAAWPSIHGDGRVDSRSMAGFQKWATDKGILDRAIPEDEFLDRGFVERASRDLGKE